VLRAEAEVIAEETALSMEEHSLVVAKQQLEMVLQQWTEATSTTEHSTVQATEEMIEQKKNELIHTKVCKCCAILYTAIIIIIITMHCTLLTK
jgi:hypothetical protein